MAEIRHLENRHDIIFFCRGWSDLVQNDMSTAVMWSKWQPNVEFQYGERLGEFNVIPEPRITLQGDATW